MSGGEPRPDRYDGPALVVADGVTVPVEARLQANPNGMWRGQVWSVDASDMHRIATAWIRVLRYGRHAARFTTDDVLDRQAHVTGTGTPPFRVGIQLQVEALSCSAVSGVRQDLRHTCILASVKLRLWMPVCSAHRTRIPSGLSMARKLPISQVRSSAPLFV
ncbi:DUF4873 domain-containing protein [Embleya sp. NPDC127516]|uniref:DUF4873 domain-containing protein n=1 Tax=Embleya sp. NPDC127516 TaxID=3363990 RepID=UPI0038233C7B